MHGGSNISDVQDRGFYTWLIAQYEHSRTPVGRLARRTKRQLAAQKQLRLVATR